QDLAWRIDSGELILSGSEEEVEVRASALHAVELIADSLQRTNRGVTPMGLDFLLWNRGQQTRYKNSPRHRTRTVYY
ncbi:MAG: queuosine salvage family protein, partial [Acidobacteriota bacterium]|nr:queuosine salvage family protein [Acidobacteriota bacterium]